MKTSFLRWPAFTLSALTWTFLSAGCILSDGGNGYDDGVVGADYYDSVGVGVDVGGWGPGYHVAPYRGGGHRPEEGERRPGGAGGHAFRPAPASRSMPSLPHGSPGGSRGHR